MQAFNIFEAWISIDEVSDVIDEKVWMLSNRNMAFKMWSLITFPLS